MIRFMVAIGIALLATSAAAQQREEPVGCDAFKWSLEGERALLLAPPEASVESGASIQPPVGKAVTIRLKPVAAAGLPMAPERPQRAQDGKAGFVRIEAPARAGPYRITLAQAGWIDVIQNGRPLRAGAFSGATGCKGVRKSVTFELEAAPFVIQISGVPADSIGLTMTPGAP